MDSPWKTERQAAEYLGLHKDTLRKRRKLGNAPKHERKGRVIRYNMADLKRYVEPMTLREASEYLNVSYETLAIWNREGDGPNVTTINGRHYYKIKDLDNFMRGA